MKAITGLIPHVMLSIISSSREKYLREGKGRQTLGLSLVLHRVGSSSSLLRLGSHNSSNQHSRSSLNVRHSNENQ
jgi:hypothetical protein